MTDGYTVNSYWGPRKDTPARLAERSRALLDRLGAISPDFSDWTYVGQKNPPPGRDYAGPDALEAYYRDKTHTVRIDRTLKTDLTPLVAAAVMRGDSGDPTPVYGYYFSFFTGSGIGPRDVSLSVHAGCYSRGRFYTNTVAIETKPACEDNAALLTLPLLKAVMLAIADVYEVTWAAVYPVELMRLWPTPPKPREHFELSWITYISPRFAPLIDPPRGPFVEYTPEGAIVMTATRDRFDVGNPLHMAAARRVGAAIAPVNALPWPPDAQPAPNSPG